MPNSTLPPDNYLGDPERTTGEFQDRINQLQNWVNTLQAELQALSSTTLGEGAVRSVNGGGGPLRANLEPTDSVQFARITDAGSPGDGDFDSDKLGYWEATVELTDQFDSGQFITFKRIGNVVTAFSDEIIQHPQNSSPSTSSNIVPSWAESPQFNPAVNLYALEDGAICQVSIDSDVTLVYRSPSDGSYVDSSSSKARILITYTV